MSWFDTKEPLTFEQEQARKLDYFSTIYGTESSRRVFAEIRSHISGLKVSTPESAIAKLALLDLIESIKESCGVSDQLSVVNAEMKAAVKFEIKPPEKEKLI